MTKKRSFISLKKTMECRTEAAISYVMFNAYWDTFIGNTINQSDKPLLPGVDTDRHVKYLLNSLRTLQKTTSLDRLSVTLWLVELAPNGLTGEALRSRIAAALPNMRLNVRTIGRPLVQRFILNAKKIPLEHYRSPNMLHEYVLLFVMSQTAEERLIIVDCDVLFVREDAPDYLLALLDRYPDKIAASFVERPAWKPFQDRQQLSRERMHTMTLVFHMTRLKTMFKLEVLMNNLDWAKQVEQVPDLEARQYYWECGVHDTFSFFTEHLKHKYPQDLLLNLNEAMEGVYEGEMLTIVSDVLIHAKYLEANGYERLLDALKERRLEGEMVEHALDLARLSREDNK